ncbi:MAG: glycoside hydrolase family 92 protein, partial [Muribaculaceae bacterium]|nr:glycoside hydrolase family 92 protein [Muribaculaceae bacterium]
DISVKVPGGKTFRVIANNCSEENKYIQSATLNGKTWDKPWISHDDVVNGGTLVLEMGRHPNKTWGASAESAPPSAE